MIICYYNIKNNLWLIMKNKTVILNKDVYTNIGVSFPEVFKKDTIGELIYIVDRDSGLTMIEIKIKNSVYLYAFKKEDFYVLK